jgi:hypothetical protein
VCVCVCVCVNDECREREWDDEALPRMAASVPGAVFTTAKAWRFVSPVTA